MPGRQPIRSRLRCRVWVCTSCLAQRRLAACHSKLQIQLKKGYWKTAGHFDPLFPSPTFYPEMEAALWLLVCDELRIFFFLFFFFFIFYFFWFSYLTAKEKMKYLVSQLQKRCLDRLPTESLTKAAPVVLELLVRSGQCHQK